jgi:acyl-CoA synthetase (AMP-forming)/AMP-acid ligase II
VKELVFSRTLLPSLEQNASQVGFTDASTGAARTFGDHLSRVSSLCGALSGDLGVEPADRIAVLSANSVPYLELWHASLLGAAVMNPLNTRFSPEEIVYVLTDSGSKVCFVDASFAEVIASLRHRTALEQVVLIGDGDGPCDARYEELLTAAAPALPAEPDETDPAVLIYTGGTTGKSKGVMIDQRAEVLNQYHFAMKVRWSPDRPFIIQTPMFHGATMLGVVGAPMFGVPSIVLPGFEPSLSLRATKEYEPGITVLVPTMIAMLLGHPDFAPEMLSSLRTIVYGASPMPVVVAAKLLECLPDTEIIHGYGMTEGCTISTALDDKDHRDPARAGSCGRALTGVGLSIQDESGAELAVGEVGEVCIRGGQFMTGYLNKPEETATALAGGWYHSGDMGYLDEDGYLYLVDRAKDMIISGGENVYSVEVEDAIASHPAVLQVAVIGIPHELWGEAVHAIVVPKPDVELTEDEVISHARSSIGGYKVPRSVSFRTEPLPMSGAMKVLKRDLRAPFWQDKVRAI